MVIAELPTGGRRTVGHSFNVKSGATYEKIEEFLIPHIERFEAQSGTGEAGPITESTVVQIYNITDSPNPETRPFTGDPANLNWTKEVKADTKRAADRARKAAKGTPTWSIPC